MRVGRGPAVLCLHSSTSSSKQWESLVRSLSDEYRIIAPDLYGYGKSPDSSGEHPFSLDHELELLESVLSSIPGPFHLIGHSYGAAVAFKLALAQPTRIRSLVVYEPVLFSLLLENEPEHESAVEIQLVREDVKSAVDSGELDQAGRMFVDYWSGQGTWESLQDWQRGTVSKRMPKVTKDFGAVMGDGSPLIDFADLDIPTLFLYGIDSPEPTRKIVQWLGQTLPKVEVRGILGLGHMGPVTHSGAVAQIIAGFIRKQPQGILVHQLRRSKPEKPRT